MRKVKDTAPLLIQIVDIICIVILLFLIGIVIFFINEGTISFTNKSPYKGLNKRYLPHIEAWQPD